MKKNKLKKLSKPNRIIVLVVTGLIIIGLGEVVTAMIFEGNNTVNEPEVVSSYKPKDNKSEELQISAVEEPVKPNPVMEQNNTWPVQLSVAESASLQVVVNKKHKLPSNYVPNLKSASGAQLRPEAADALGILLQDAVNAGVPMNVLSSYRSYSTQVSTYDRWVSQSGQAAADTYSARPGHSEHQLGLAVDLGDSNSRTCDLETCFGNTPPGQWLIANAQKYGFIIRYPQGNQTETGYQYEPWHLRYVGIDVASTISNSGKTLDQYYGVEAGDYN